MYKKDFLSMTDITAPEILQIVSVAGRLKTELQEIGANTSVLDRKSLVMIFEKPSLRTRLSFEIAMTQLGGHALYLGPSDIGLGVRESVQDIAAVAGSMGDILMARTFAHTTVEQLAQFSNVPVINGLSDLEHPCQGLADFMTMRAVKGDLKGLTIAYVGDGENNIPHTLCLGAAMLGMTFRCASPQGYEMRQATVNKAKDIAVTTGAHLYLTENPKAAVENADVVYTDTWVSMGDEAEREKRCQIFQAYQVTSTLMKLAKKDAIFLHDLPAYRGFEVAAEVIDGPQSRVFEQAENRLHAQKALLLYVLGKI